MDFSLKTLFVVTVFFILALCVCVDAFAVGHVAEHAYSLLIAPHIANAPTLSWKVFAGGSIIFFVCTMQRRITPEHEDVESKNDIIFALLKLLVLGLIYVAIGWIA